MKETIKIILIILISIVVFLGIIWCAVWAFSKLNTTDICVRVPYYGYSVKGTDESAGKDLEKAKELANGRNIYIRGYYCE